MRTIALICIILSVTVAAIAQKKVVCSWTPDSGRETTSYQERFVIENLDKVIPRCSHFIYPGVRNFASGNLFIDDMMKPPYDYLQKFSEFRDKNQNLKLLVGLGGPNQGRDIFHTLGGSLTARNYYVNQVKSLVENYTLDGIDFDWQYPGIEPDWIASDRGYFIDFLTLFRNALGSSKIISVTVGATPEMIQQAYNVPEILKLVDFINLKTFNLRGDDVNITQETAFHSPLRAFEGQSEPFSEWNVVSIVENWENEANGVNINEKLIIGVSTFGRSFTLDDPNENGVGAPASKVGRRGSVLPASSVFDGQLAFREICLGIIDANWEENWDRAQEVPYAVFENNQWVGYDNVKSAVRKIAYAKNNPSVGGVNYARLELEDWANLCDNEKDTNHPELEMVYPLVYWGYQVLINGEDPPDYADPPIPTGEITTTTEEITTPTENSTLPGEPNTTTSSEDPFSTTTTSNIKTDPEETSSATTIENSSTPSITPPISTEPTTSESEITSESTTEIPTPPVTPEITTTTSVETTTTSLPEETTIPNTSDPYPSTNPTEEETTTTSELSTEPSTEPTQEQTTTSPIPSPSSTLSSEGTTQPPGNEPNFNSLCYPSKTGNIRHPYECTKYIACVHGYAWVMNCPNYLYYNETVDQCLYQSETECIIDGTTPIPNNNDKENPPPQADPPLNFNCPANVARNFAHPYDCTLFISCVWGYLYVRECPERGTDIVLYYDEELDACVWPWETDCQASPPEITPPPEETTTQSSTVSVPTTTSSSEIPTVSTTLFPPTDPDLTTLSPPSEQTTLSPPTTISSTSAPPPGDPPIDFECPPGENRNFAHPYDCTLFISCVWGIPYVMSCPNNLHYNETLDRCLWPWQQPCDLSPPAGTPPVETTQSSTVSVPSEQTTLPPPSEQTTLSPPTTVSSTIIPPPGDPPLDFYCPANVARNFAHPYDCTLFISCVWGYLYVRECPERGTDIVLHYDEELDACVWPWETDCQASPPEITPPPEETTTQSSTISVPTTTSSSEISTESTTLFPPTDPDQTTLSPPSEQTTLSPPTTISSTSAPPPGDPPIDFECPPGENRNFAHPYDCTLFISCVWGIPYVMSCPHNLHFNETLDKCLWPWEQPCDLSPPAGTPPSDTTQSSTVSIPSEQTTLSPPSEQTTLSPPSEQTTVSSTVIPPPGEPPLDFECPPNVARNFAHPSDCTLFISCVWGHLFVRECPDRIAGVTLYYEESIDECVWPWESTCTTS